MSDENDIGLSILDEEAEEPTYAYNVLVTRVQEGMLIVDATSADEAKSIAEDDWAGADWETVHWEIVNAELSGI